ncbi:MAG: PHP domain-containing protein [Chloroflexi bacterium]|nr:PHP domain-containing protein [Chloroflexota bacterium]
MGTADLHIHTAQGDGMAEIPELLAYVEEETDLSVIAITDHDDLRPALAAREAWARGNHRFDLVVGEEVTTIEGHLLALFIERPVPSLKRLVPTLAAVHAQGGLCIIPHPMSWLTRSISSRTMERVMRDEGDGVYFDGMETASSPAARVRLRTARRLNRERLHLAEVGGSDGHFLQAIGASQTVFEGSTAEDLRRAITGRSTRAVAGPYPSLLQIGLVNVARQQWRGIMVTPRQMGWLPTIGSFLKRARP